MDVSCGMGVGVRVYVLSGVSSPVHHAVYVRFVCEICGCERDLRFFFWMCAREHDILMCVT